MKDFISFIEFWVHVIIFKIELKISNYVHIKFNCKEIKLVSKILSQHLSPIQQNFREKVCIVFNIFRISI